MGKGMCEFKELKEKLDVFSLKENTRSFSESQVGLGVTS